MPIETGSTRDLAASVVRRAGLDVAQLAERGARVIVSEYVNAALGTELELLDMREWRDADAARADPPRLVTLHLRRRGNRG